MKQSLKVGICFGITSGIITTLGLMVGLSSGTHSKLVVIGGILTIAVADAFSDALGIHISEESHEHKPAKEVWESTISTFLAKFLFALTFLIPVLLLELNLAMIVSVIWGLSVLSILSYILVRRESIRAAWKAVFEHLATAVVVIILTYYIGGWIATRFV